MAQRNKNTLKSYFNTGDKPTEQQFVDLIDSFHNKVDEPIVQSVNGQTGNVTISPSQENDVVGSMNYGILKYNIATHSTENIFHIKLPYKIDTHNRTFYIHATGYTFSSADIIDIVWVGYCHKDASSQANKLRNFKVSVNRSTEITAGLYVGTDNHIYLWFKVPNTYYTTFRLDAMRVGNGTLLAPNSVDVVLSPLAQL